MEYRLNKIDTDLRVKIQQETSNDKIHYSKKVNQTKDMIEERKNSSNNFFENNNQRNQKKKIIIDGIKYGEEINVKAEKLEELSEDNSKGRTLDMRK